MNIFFVPRVNGLSDNTVLLDNAVARIFGTTQDFTQLFFSKPLRRSPGAFSDFG
jgi:hypothetical protein